MSGVYVPLLLDDDEQLGQRVTDGVAASLDSGVASMVLVGVGRELGWHIVGVNPGDTCLIETPELLGEVW